jgi:flagellar hook-basal body complex protein FliE
MITSVAAIQHVAPLQPLALEPVVSKGSGADFLNVLNNAVASVEQTRQTADQTAQGFLDGTGGELHSAILATQRAELQFQMFLQVRNKIVQAYQEVMRVQV